MMQQVFARSSALVLSLLVLGASATATSDFEGINFERLRAAPGQQGIGLGALSVPTYSELGELNVHLYDDQDVAQYWVHASMSKYLPTTFLAPERREFGGISGQLRGLESQGAPHPTFVGLVEGTWEMDGQGRGTINAVAYRIDDLGQNQPIGVLSGEFEAVAIVQGSPGYLDPPKFGEESLAFMGKSIATKARAFAASDGFASRPSDLEYRIRQARLQAQQAKGSSTSELPAIPVEVHLAAHVLMRYKLVE